MSINVAWRRAISLRPVGLVLLLAAFNALPAAAQGPLPKVTIIATGGTIAGQSESPTSFQSYRAGQILITDMVNELRPQIDSVAEITTVQFGNRGSGGYTIPEYYDLGIAIDEALETADAVVVTTGTGTQDEFVYWSELTVQSQKPVVFTGAMRPWTVVGTDAHANLFNAIVLAASGETHCFGTVNILNDEFHAAKEVWKSDGMRMDTFIDRKVGILGYVDELDVRTFRAPPRIQRCADPGRWRTPFDLSRIARDELPRVEVLMGYQDAGLDEAVLAWAEAGVDGIVLAGGRPSAEAKAAAEAKGVVFTSTQRFRSGGDNLMPQKARLLLLLALAFSDDPEQVALWIDDIGGLEFEVAQSAVRQSTR
jgi:L-asparaginase